ncbi:MAG: helix-turn-helix domain-containing protein [Novosphingobium sp.]
MKDAQGYFASTHLLMDSLGAAPTHSTARKNWCDIQMCAWEGIADVCAYDSPSDLLIIYQLAGTARVSVTTDQRRYATTSRAGLVSIIHFDSSVRWDIGGEFSSLSLHITEDFVRKHGCDALAARQLPSRPSLAVSNPFVTATLDVLAEKMRSQIDHDGSVAEALTAALITFIDHGLRDGMRVPTPRALADDALNKVYDFVDQSLEQNISVNDLAALVDMPVTQFARQFYTATQITPYQFVIERRLRQAYDMLRESDEDISEIALRCGFSSQSHFSSVFKKLRGLTPAAYR